MKENLVSKEHQETLSEFEAKVDAAKLEAAEQDLDGDPVWVETSQKICDYFNRKRGMGKAGYFHYRGVQVCPYGQSEELKAKLAVQLGTLVHGDAHVNQISATVPKASSG